MLDERNKMLIQTINKLHRRGADRNIKKILEKTHSADVASILEALEISDRHSIFQMLNTKLKAETLSRLSKDTQKELSVLLEPLELKQILSEMDSDDVADFIGYLPEDISQNILTVIKGDEFEDVEEILSYPEDSAGRIMSSELLYLTENISVGETIKIIQDSDEDLISFYIYVVNDSNQLVGVLSLKQVLLSKPSVLLKDVMLTDVICVDVSTNQQDVAKIVEKYDFLSLPVVDGNNKLVGVITVDDVIDIIREEAQEDFLAKGMAGILENDTLIDHLKSRSPWLAMSFVCGALIYSICLFWLKLMGSDLVGHSAFLAVNFMPVSIILISIISNQSSTIMVGAIRSGVFSTVKAFNFFRAEMIVSTIISFVLSLFSFIFIYLLLHDTWLAYFSSCVLFSQILFCSLLSLSLPVLIDKLDLDPTAVSIPYSMIISNIFSVLVLIFVYWIFF